MLCALSGRSVVEPVVSPSGKVYERALIETWIAERGTDPASGAPLSPDQLVKLDLVPANPELTTTTSIPGLMQSLQTEFNSLVLENFELKNRLADVTAERDAVSDRVEAALRVITRITLERDELRHALEQLDLSNDHVEAPAPEVAAEHPGNDVDGDTKAGSDVEMPEQPDSPHATDQVPDLLGAAEPPVPPVPRVPASDPPNISRTAKLLTAERRRFNTKAAKLSFNPLSPKLINHKRGHRIWVFSSWALIQHTSPKDGYWELVDLKTLKTQRFNAPVYKASFLGADTPQLALLSPGEIAVRALDSAETLYTVQVEGDPQEALWHPSGYLLVRYLDRIDFVQAGALVEELSVAVDRCFAFAIHPDGEYLIYHSAGADDGSIAFFSLTKRKIMRTVEVAGRVDEIEASANGYLIAFVARARVQIIDLRNDSPPSDVALPGNPEVLQARFDSTGRRLLVSGKDSTYVSVYKLREWVEHVPVDTLGVAAVSAWSGPNMQVPLGIELES